MATPPSLLARMALMCMALLVIPSSAFAPTFPTTSHALRLRSARCPIPQLRVAVPLLQMSGGRGDTDNDNHANVNRNNDEYAGSRSTDTR